MLRKLVTCIAQRFFSAMPVAVVVSLTLTLLADRGVTQNVRRFETPSETSATTSATTTENSTPAVRAFPRAEIRGGRRIEYLGSFSPNGKYKPLTKFGRALDAMMTASVHDDDHKSTQETSGRTREAPSGVVLHSEERRVEDVRPPGHLVETVKPQSVLGSIHDAIVRFTYGPEKVIKQPYGVATDSRQRVIITDPAAHSVHVLDLKGKDSFRIVGGENRRLQTPMGVAVDSADNIYVSDQELGRVLVYDGDGNFLRYIGDFKGENFYQRPSGIALDSKSGCLYLLDTPRNYLYVLDLQGNIRERWGSRDGGTGPGQFKNPTQIVVHEDEVIVLDQNGSRVQVLGQDGTFRKQFTLKDDDDAAIEAIGLAVDTQGNIYVSDEDSDLVRVYDNDGHSLGVFGRTGARFGEFDTPAGLWMDSADHIYVVDSNNRRLQIFQVNKPQ